MDNGIEGIVVKKFSSTNKKSKPEGSEGKEFRLFRLHLSVCKFDGNVGRLDNALELQMRVCKFIGSESKELIWLLENSSCIKLFGGLNVPEIELCEN